MRRLINLYTQDNEKLEWGNGYYTYDDYNNLVPVTNIETESGIIISNSFNLREKKFLIDTIDVTANDILSKQQRTDNFNIGSLTTTGSGILVGQGEDTPPIWKTFDSVFPSSIFQLGEGEALLIEGSTMNYLSFDNDDAISYIFNESFINKKNNYELSTVGISNDYSYYSGMKTMIVYTPFLANIISINGTDNTNGDIYNKGMAGNFIIETVYEYDSTKNIKIYVYNKLRDDLREYECELGGVSSDTTKQNYKIYLPLTYESIEGDDYIYLGNIDVRTSLTEKSEYMLNYKVNEVESVKPKYKYTTEIKGEQNSITSTIPLNTDIAKISISEHHGFYIDSTGVLNGFGIEYKGEIVKKPSGLDFLDVSCGMYHNVAIDDNNELYSWGSDDFGQVTNTPSGTFKKVYAFDNMSAAISMTDELHIWGESIFYDYRVDNIMTDVMDFAFGERFALILHTNGDITCLGDDTFGQKSNIPIDKFRKVSAGRYHCCAISEDSTFYIWGSNNEGQQSGAENVTETVRDISCTDFGGGYISNNDIFVPFGEIVGTSNQVYQKVISGNSNIVLLKNGTMSVEKQFKKIDISGNMFNMRIDIDLPDVAITKIYTDLDVLL